MILSKEELLTLHDLLQEICDTEQYGTLIFHNRTYRHAHALLKLVNKQIKKAAIEESIDTYSKKHNDTVRTKKEQTMSLYQQALYDYYIKKCKSKKGGDK